MPYAIVTFCSHTGATRQAAQDIAALLGADLVEVDDLHDGKGAEEPDEHGELRNFRQYDVVIAGASTDNPCGWDCVRTFLARASPTLPRVAFFCVTSFAIRGGGESAAYVFEQWTAAAKKSPVATVVLPLSEIECGHVSPELYGFANEIRMQVPVAPVHEIHA